MRTQDRRRSSDSDDTNQGTIQSVNVGTYHQVFKLQCPQLSSTIAGGEWFQLNIERLEPGAVGSLDAELVAESF